jgi:hypothetical protein
MKDAIAICEGGFSRDVGAALLAAFKTGIAVGIEMEKQEDVH